MGIFLFQVDEELDYNSILYLFMAEKMVKVNRRIELNRLKIQGSGKYKELFILMQVGGKNVYQSYTQKVKNNTVNFYGQSAILQVEDGELTLKVVNPASDPNQNILASFTPKITQFQPIRKQNITSLDNDFSLNWACQPTDLNETDDEDLFCTNYNISELHDPIYTNDMIQRKIKKCYSTQLHDNQQSDDQKSTYSQINLPKNQ